MMKVFTVLGILAMAPALGWAQGNIDSRCTQPSQVACVDWTNAVAIAIGTGAPATWAKTPAQKNISATRAARLDAARNLIELIKGIHLNTTTSVEGAMVANDTVQTAIQGRLYGIRPVAPPKYFSDGSVQVKLEARLREIIPENLYMDTSAGPPRVLDAAGATMAGSSPLMSGQVYTGLIIDARGTKVTPAMSPKIFDPKGLEVYGSAYVDHKWAVSQGVVGYVKSLQAAEQNDRVKGNPAIVKAIAVKGASGSDLEISQADADALREISQQQTFLRESRVMIVLD